MKWVFLAGLLVLTPLLMGLLRSQPRYLLHACFLMGLGVFFVDPWLGAAPISWTFWTGAVKGIEVTIVDSIALAILVATRPVRIPIAIKIGFGIYVAAVFIATLAGQVLMPSLFYAWQLGRAVLVFVATARAAATVERAPFALVAGIGVAILIECVVAVQQFAGGAFHAGGTVGHQNMLGLSSHFATMTAAALLLAGKRMGPAVAVVLAGGLIAFVGSSRATIGLYLIGLVVTVLLSIRHHRTGRKAGFAFAALAAAGLAAPALMFAIDRRSESQIASSNRERANFNEAAKMIIMDHPLGVGGSQYVVIANLGGYLDRAGAAWNFANRSAPVHNSYYLVAAELGILGLIGMIATFAALLGTGLSALKNVVRSDRSELLVGLVSALIIVFAHIGYEWLFMHWMIHYLMAMTAGTMVGIAVADRKSRVTHRAVRDRVEQIGEVPTAALRR